MDESSESVFFGGLMAVIFLVAVLINVLLLVLLIKKRVINNSAPARLLIYNTVIVDLVSSLDCLVSAVGNFNQSIILKSKEFCEFEGGRRWFIRNLALFSFLLLTINRFLTTAKPHLVKQVFSKKKTILYILINWLIPLIVVMFFAFLENKPPKIDPLTNSCILTISIRSSRFLLSIFLAVFFAVIALYIKTALSYKARRTQIRNQTIRKTTANAEATQEDTVKQEVSAKQEDSAKDEGRNEQDHSVKQENHVQQEAPTKVDHLPDKDDPAKNESVTKQECHEEDAGTAAVKREKKLRIYQLFSAHHQNKINASQKSHLSLQDTSKPNSRSMSSKNNLIQHDVAGKRSVPTQSHNNNRQVQASSSSDKIRTTFVIITICYFSSFIFLYSVLLSQHFMGVKHSLSLGKAAYALQASSFFLNGLIFFIVNKKFRQEAWKLFTRN